MSDKIFVSELDTDIINAWYDSAKDVTRNTLDEFISNIMDKHCFDYGAYVHAIAVCAIATSWACGVELSGYQASMVGLQFVNEWTYGNVKTGISIRNWDDMLYPQYRCKFEKTIPMEVWVRVQEQAKEKLNNIKTNPNEFSYINEDVVNHWESIAKGKIPFGYTIEELQKLQN